MAALDKFEKQHIAGHGLDHGLRRTGPPGTRLADGYNYYNENRAGCHSIWQRYVESGRDGYWEDHRLELRKTK